MKLSRVWVGLAVSLLIWLLVAQAVEVKAVLAALAGVDVRWFFIALVLQVLYYLGHAFQYKLAFQVVGQTWRLWELVWLILATLFVNAVAPSGGLAGGALFVSEAEKGRRPASGVAVGLLLQKLTFYLSFVPILGIGMSVLFRHHALKYYHLLGCFGVLAVIVVTCCLLIGGMIRPASVQRFLLKVRAAINAGLRLFRRPPLAEAWAERLAVDLQEASLSVTARPSLVAQATAVGMLAHILDVASLWCLFHAMGVASGLGVVVAGFSVALLFWLVSVTPQGVGIVEGGMILVLGSLGVPTVKALSIALIYRAITFWFPSLLGFLALTRPRLPTTGLRKSLLAWTPGLLACATAFSGVVTMFSAASPAVAERLQHLRHFVPLDVRSTAHVITLACGLTLILLADGLRRRKRNAWRIATVALGLSVGSHLLKGFDYEEALLALVTWLWLLASQAEFMARSDAPTFARGIPKIALALLLTMTYGTVGIHRLTKLSWGEAASEACRAVLGLTRFVPSTRGEHLFLESLQTFAGLVVLGSLVIVLSPVFLRAPATPEERRRAQSIVECYGRSSLAFFTLLPDKNYCFTETGAVLAFALKGRVALVLGDAIGPPDTLAGTLDEWSELCRSRDWVPAFTQILPDGLETYRAAGYRSICLGEEAIITLQTFSLAGGHYKSLRPALRKISKTGFTFRVHEPPLSVALLSELRRVSDAWLMEKNGQEKGFSLGWFSDDYIGNCRVAAIHSDDGEVVAFTNFVPEYQLNELTIDLMRRSERSPKGVMDFLFVSIFEYAKKEGFDSVSLGLSPLAGVGEQTEDPLAERALHFIYEHVNQFYNFQGLHQFKEKFEPSWSPRYLVFRPGTLPGVARALMQASSGDHFLWDQAWSFLRSQRSKRSLPKASSEPQESQP